MHLSFWLALAGVTAAAASAAEPETAILAGGCFWCLEAKLEALPGVISVETGYTGGTVPDPTFQSVLAGDSGHVVAVRVTFDPDRIGYRRLLFAYSLAIDPTDGDGQFCERGPEYRPAIYYAGEAQRRDAVAAREEVARAFPNDRVATAILPAERFWPAEAAMQDYAENNPSRYDFFLRACGRDEGLRRVWSRGALIADAPWPGPAARLPDGRTAR